eukprot:4953091-Amphidinium_carterae.1
MIGKTASATNDVRWVDELSRQDVISMCNVRDTMNAYYSSQGRQPNFPRVADPDFNPDVDFQFNDHGQTMEPNAQCALNLPTGAPTIIRIGEPAANVQQPPQLNQQTIQAWNAPQLQQRPN